MGVTVDTPTNLIVGAGDVQVDTGSGFGDIGATTGNNLFAIDRTIFTPELNGLKGALIGTDYITRSEGHLECTIPEVSAAILAVGWPGSSSSGTSPVVIDEDNTRRIPVSDYNNWKLNVERLGGGTFEFFADNAIQTSTLSYEAADAALAAPRYTLMSRWDPADLTASPHRIKIFATGS